MLNSMFIYKVMSSKIICALVHLLSNGFYLTTFGINSPYGRMCKLTLQFANVDFVGIYFLAFWHNFHNYLLKY